LLSMARYEIVKLGNYTTTTMDVQLEWRWNWNEGKKNRISFVLLYIETTFTNKQYSRLLTWFDSAIFLIHIEFVYNKCFYNIVCFCISVVFKYTIWFPSNNEQ
jgi:hypothetical protein